MTGMPILQSPDEFRYAHQPWLSCDTCHRNTWRKLRHGAKAVYCSLRCETAKQGVVPIQ